jgi:hypothetical protein
MPSTRRAFLQQISAAAAAYSSAVLLGGSSASALQSPTTTRPTRVYVDTRRTIAPIAIKSDRQFPHTMLN